MATVTSTIKIGPADHGRLMTLDEFLEAEVEEGYRYELARGVLEVTHVPNDPHGSIVWNILRFIALYDTSHPQVIHRAGGGSEFRFWLPAMISGRNPDVGVALRGTPKDWRGRRPASLAFEVVSEGSEAHERDYVTKSSVLSCCEWSTRRPADHSRRPSGISRQSFSPGRFGVRARRDRRVNCAGLP
jgi:Uma2 family endonuclease